MSVPRLTVEIVGDVRVVRFRNRHLMDEQLVCEVQEQLSTLAHQPGYFATILDFGNVESVSSFMLASLITADEGFRGAGRALILAGMNPRIFEAVERTTLLCITVTTQTALATLANAGSRPTR